MMSWLECDADLQADMTKLRCSVCSKFKSQILGRRNYDCCAESVRIFEQYSILPFH